MFAEGGIGFSLQIIHFRLASSGSDTTLAEVRLRQIRRLVALAAFRKFLTRIGTSLLAGPLNRIAEPAKNPPSSASSSLEKPVGTLPLEEEASG
jgi:hypothetical protein